MAYRFVGNKTPRVEGRDKVTGKARYAADIQLPGLLWGKILRSPYAHARILAIDTSAAQRLPGVRAVVTGLDHRHLVGRTLRDAPVLAFDKVRFIGDRVAAVAADSADLAEQALALIEVDYEELPALFDPTEACLEHAPRLHDDPHGYPGAPPMPEELRERPNLRAFNRWQRGDVAAAFAQAKHVFEHSFTTQRQHHGYIEPHACVVAVQPDGGCEVWASNKSPYLLRMQIGAAMAIDPSRVRVHPLHVGGDFGGKGTPMDAPVAYLLSRASGRPVKLVMAYTEELLAANSRHPGLLRIKTAVDTEGRFQAMEFHGLFAGGAYGCHRPLPNNNIHGMEQVGSCYRIPNILIESSVVYTNTLPGGHMRSPGGPQVNLAVEAHLDLIANALRMDRAELRMKNLLRPGDASPLGEQWLHIKARETLQAALDAVDWPNRQTPPHTGWGIAMYERSAIGGDSSCKIRLQEDGKVLVVVPIPDPGQGAYTAIQQMVAEQLDITPERIGILAAHTDDLPFDLGVGGSRTTVALGVTATGAAAELQKQLLASMAAITTEQAGPGAAPKPALYWADGRLWDGAQSWSFEAVAAHVCRANAGPLVIDWRQSLPIMPEPAETAFTAQIAQVRVDPETGVVRVAKLVTAHDVGTIVNPVGHQGQIEGGALFGVGGALIEEHRIEDGLPVALHLGDYKIPCIQDIPPLETILLERDHGPGPFNIGAIAEAANVPTASAIVNAVAEAIGKPVFNLPLTADRMLKLIRE